MKVVLIQADILWADPEGNRSHLDALLETLPGADLYLLPEMFSTGFVAAPAGAAEAAPAPTLAWMQAWAGRRNAALGGSIALQEADGSFHNRFYFVRPDGSVESSDKRHLFSFAGEDAAFSPGRRRKVISWRGLRLLPLVCYDLRFPVWSRYRSDDPYDVLLYVASWPEKRQKAWDLLLQARAVENRCYVCGVNRCGKDPSNRYLGGTAAIGPEGEILARVADGAEGWVLVDLDKTALDASRKAFPVLSDADGYELKDRKD